MLMPRAPVFNVLSAGVLGINPFLGLLQGYNLAYNPDPRYIAVDEAIEFFLFSMRQSFQNTYKAR